MSNKENVVTLPEITIEGSADLYAISASDWWCQGFTTGFNAPDTPVERPLMINDDLASSFYAGAESGQNVRRELQAEFDERYRDSQQVVPDIGGEAYDEVQRRYNEEWEALFHNHLPHTEVEGEPGPTLVRPNIIIIPE